MKYYIVFALIVAIAGCSNPKATVVPTSLEKMEAIKPSIEKLSPDEKDLFAKYVVRHTVGYAMSGMFGIKSDPIPEGITIGKAIEEQREFGKKQEAAEKEEKALQAKLAAEREKAMDAMRQAVSVTIMGKRINTEYGSSDIVIDELLSVKFGYRNNTVSMQMNRMAPSARTGQAAVRKSARKSVNWGLVISPEAMANSRWWFAPKPDTFPTIRTL
jgi:hypothetical protein